MPVSCPFPYVGIGNETNLILNLLVVRLFCSLRRRNDRVAEGARLESAYTPKGYRGFESRFLRYPQGLSFSGRPAGAFVTCDCKMMMRPAAAGGCVFNFFD